jgi:hypothetical protein
MGSFCRSGLLLLSVWIGIVTVITDRVGATCVCDSASEKSRKLHKKRDVAFETASFGGDGFKRPLGGSKLYTNDEYLDNYAVSDGCVSEQIHLTLGDTYGSMIISYASFGNETIDSAVTYYASGSSASSATTVDGVAYSYSQLLFVKKNLYDPFMGAPESNAAIILARQNTSRWAFVESSGLHWSNWYNYTTIQLNAFPYNNPYGTYNSPLLHTVEIKGLTPGTTYYYTVAGSCTQYEFVIPVQSSYPMTVGLTGDIGQTQVSAASVSALEAMNPAAVFLVGDLSYADGWTFLWDSFGALMEPLAANVPLLTTGGNHEIDNGENWMSYMTRYPTAYRGSGSTNPCYWAREVGVMNVIAICSYAGFHNSSLQYRWLAKYLSTSIDRTRTPWIVVMMHIPLYNSNKASHWMEGELMRRALEPVFYQYGVDIVLAGHVHAYERTYPVFNGTVDNCGPTYINIGDGGNYEGWATTWWNISQSEAEAEGAGYAWSAFREDSFGVGQIEFLNDTVAAFNWHRHACGSDSPTDYYMNFSDSCVSPQDNSAQRMLTSDKVNIIRYPNSQCPNRYVSTATTTTSSSSSNNNMLPGGIIAVIVVFVVVFTFSMYFLYTLQANAKKNKGMDASLMPKGGVQITPVASPRASSVNEI